jgi:hypothetical protein
MLAYSASAFNTTPVYDDINRRSLVYFIKTAYIMWFVIDGTAHTISRSDPISYSYRIT